MKILTVSWQIAVNRMAQIVNYQMLSSEKIDAINNSLVIGMKKDVTDRKKTREYPFTTAQKIISYSLLLFATLTISSIVALIVHIYLR